MLGSGSKTAETYAILQDGLAGLHRVWYFFGSAEVFRVLKHRLYRYQGCLYLKTKVDAHEQLPSLDQASNS